MHKNLIIVFITLSLCLLVVLSPNTSNPTEATYTPKAINGVLDLTGWTWEQNGIVALNGQWEFYWQELFSPEDFKEVTTATKKEFIILPRAWNNYATNGEKLLGSGYATYRLLIHDTSNQILGIKVPRIFTSYNLWANGELVASAGAVGIDHQQMIPQYLPQISHIKPGIDTLELVVQVANFRHRSGES